LKGPISRLLEIMSIALRPLQSDVEDSLKKQPKIAGQGAGQIYLAPETAKVFDYAEKKSQKMGDEFVTVERLFEALCAAGNDETIGILKKAGITTSKVESAISTLRQGRKASSASAEESYEALKKYARDM